MSPGFLLSITRKTKKVANEIEGGPDDLHRGWITLFCVRDDLRRKTLGSQMFEAAENRMRAIAISEIWVSPYTPNYWTPGIDEANYPGAIEFLKKRGYEVRSRPLAMAVDLSKSWSVPEWAIARECELNQSYDLQIAPVSPRDRAAPYEVSGGGVSGGLAAPRKRRG